jgi:nitrite reductase/ring-hydroxylating ferredoxin subunit
MMNPTSSFYVRVLLVFGVFSVLAISCKKETPAPEIPFTYVNFSLNPNGTQYLSLNGVGGWETVTGGYKGILIYRKSINEFMAYERACPYDPLVSGAQIRVDKSAITCTCPICASKFIITDGSPYAGPSHYPLKQYTTVYDGAMLYISN